MGGWHALLRACAAEQRLACARQRCSKRAGRVLARWHTRAGWGLQGRVSWQGGSQTGRAGRAEASVSQHEVMPVSWGKKHDGCHGMLCTCSQQRHSQIGRHIQELLPVGRMKDGMLDELRDWRHCALALQSA